MSIKGIINNKAILRVVSAILILLWCSLIFFMSSEVADDSAKRSSGFINKVARAIAAIFETDGPDSEALSLYEFYLRKLAHMFLYFVLAILSFLFVSTFDLSWIQAIMLSLVFCVFYATTDEVHQLFVEGRSGSVRDVLIDTCGALIGLLLCRTFDIVCSKLKK